MRVLTALLLAGSLVPLAAMLTALFGVARLRESRRREAPVLVRESDRA
jgi:hypothetical protein